MSTYDVLKSSKSIFPNIFLFFKYFCLLCYYLMVVDAMKMNVGQILKTIACILMKVGN